MLFNKKITSAVETFKQNIQNKFDYERVQMIEISKLTYDKDFKELFAQEPEKVERIAQDMKIRGFDKSQPIIATKEFKILDGHSRYLASQKAGIKFVPVVFKDFSDKNEALKYELHLQLDRRNLTDSEILKMFSKLEELKSVAKSEGKSTEEYSDAKIAEQLNKSERQVQKIRELTKKADEATLNKISDGKLSINQAYSEIKKSEKPVSDESRKINKSEFIKGVQFALQELEQGKTAEEILASL